MLTIVTYLTVSAFPIVRENEALTQAKGQLVSALRAAQTQALDEQRHPDCLARVGDDPRDEKRCSDVGIMLQGTQIITFADINDDNKFDNEDFRLQTSSFVKPVNVVSPVSLLVEATPPNVILFVNGVPLGADDDTTVILKAIMLRSRQRELPLSISSYGVVER
jgi:hypothetical protein